METATPIALLAFVVFTLLNLVRYTRGGFAGQGWNGTITILSAWLIGFVAAWVFGESDVGASLVIPGFSEPLGDMGVFDLILVGLAIASTAGAFNELRGAIDQSSSTVKPTLVQDTAQTQN